MAMDHLSPHDAKPETGRTAFMEGPKGYAFCCKHSECEDFKMIDVIRHIEELHNDPNEVEFHAWTYTPS